MSERILRRPAVESKVGLKRSALYDLIAQGKFPKPIRVGDPDSSAGAVGWLESEIDSWLAARIAARETSRPVA